MRKIGIVAPASHREDPNMLPVLRIKYPNPKPRKNETNAKPRRIDENSASTTLAAQIAAWRKFESRKPRFVSHLFRNKTLNHNSSLYPLATANIRKNDVRDRNN